MTTKDELIGKRFPVLDKGYIELLDFMPHPLTGVSGDLAVVNAARVSFMGESKGDMADKKLLMYLLRNKHTSPFEMCVFKFRVCAPLVTFWQWARHRAASYNAESGRYVEFSEGEFYVPEVWRMQSKNNKQASEGQVDSDVNSRLTEKLLAHYDESFKLYEEALTEGVAREMARLFLPGFSVYYTWVIKVDAHNLMHFLKLRMAQEAQYEIRVYADIIYNEMFKVMMPWTAESFEQYVLGDN